MPETEVVAILCSDIHLSHTAPIARSAEEDWYAAMARPLDELNALQIKYDVPVFIAGDIFDRWNSFPSLINFAIDTLPEKIFAIPGQHDLPNHVYDEMSRSAYGTLVRSKKITHLPPGEQEPVYGVQPTSFPWGFPLKPLSQKSEEFIGLAIVHAYCWAGQHKYFGATDESHINTHKSKLEGYDVAVFGDNHLGFVSGRICNCGGFMRRKIDEIEYKPFVALLHSDRSISQHFLDTSQDKFIEVSEEAKREAINIEGFVEGLKSLSSDPLDFRDAVRRYIIDNHVSKGVSDVILEVLK